MTFSADPDYIDTLDANALVELMKLLLLSECRLAGIPLRAASVPLQITVADGGEDGCVRWQGGSASTPFLPARYTAFQSKAQSLSIAHINKEVLKQNKDGTLKLNDTIVDVLNSGGAYIVFCREAMVTTKRKKLVKAISDAISSVGEDPKRAAAIEVYDANLIADWVNTHPSVALWLASRRLGRNLYGFQTRDAWGTYPHFSTPWQLSDEQRYEPVNYNINQDLPKSDDAKAWDFTQAAKNILEFLGSEKAVVRVSGPSGFGKSRFVYEIFGFGDAIADKIDAASIMFCDGAVSGSEVARLALEFADTGNVAIIVVDECTDELHERLANIVKRTNSKLRLLTIDIETKVLQAEGTLSIRVSRASEALIKKIVSAASPKLSNTDRDFIVDIAEGFPEMAVLAAKQGRTRRHTFSSVESVLDRIVWRGKQRVDEAQSALQVASMFDWIAVRGDAATQTDCIASDLAGMSRSVFVKHLLSFKNRGIIAQRGDYLQICPLPLSARLCAAQLEVMTADQLLHFICNAPETVQLSMLKRLKWLDGYDVVVELAERLLAPDCLGNLIALNTKFGSMMLERLVHLSPDVVSNTVDHVFGALSSSELQDVQEGRRYLVWTLEKLVFRRETFYRSARLLLRLAAAENEGNSNNASGQFQQLFQLYLSGTEAGPSDRLLVLDEGLQSYDLQQRAICVKALGVMLIDGHYSRMGGSAQIGSAEALIDWKPDTYGQIWEFYRSAISRLVPIASRDDEFATEARDILSKNVRGLLGRLPTAEIKKMIEDVSSCIGFWPEAMIAVSQFLYYDRSAETPREIAKSVRQLYDDLLPTNVVDLAILYTRGWVGDLFDPDKRYNPKSEEKNKYDYAEKRAVMVAQEVATKKRLMSEVVKCLACSTGHGTYPFAKALMKVSVAPEFLFKRAIDAVEEGGLLPNERFFVGLLVGAKERNKGLAKRLLRKVLLSEKLKEVSASLIAASGWDDDSVGLLVGLIANGEIKPCRLKNLGLSGLSECQLLEVLKELEGHGYLGLWCIIDAVGKYLYWSERTPTAPLVEYVKGVMLLPPLMEVTTNNMDGYHFAQMVGRLDKWGELDREYALKMARQVMRVCGTKTGRIFYGLDDPIRKVLGILVKKFPEDTWGVIVEKITSKDSSERFYARCLLTLSYQDDHLAKGMALSVPSALYMDWVRKNPNENAKIVVDWLPIASRENAESPYKWSAELVEFVDEFADVSGVLLAISRRLSPTSWSGSLATYLEPLVPLVETWRGHRNGSVRVWVAETLLWLEQDIKLAKNRHDEDVVHYG